MGMTKTIIFGIAGATLLSSFAMAHPPTKSDDTDKTEKTVKVYKFKSDEDGEKDSLTINGVEVKDFDLGDMLQSLDHLEDLKDLKELKNLKGLSKLSELSKLTELGELDFEAFDMEDGGKKIIIKRGKGGVLGEHELFLNDDGEGGHNIKLMDKHGSHHGSDDESSRVIIKKMVRKQDGDHEIEVWTDKDTGRHGDHKEVGGETRIVLDKDGEVKVLNDNGDTQINVDKEVTIRNGKRKTRIVIEMETDVE